MHKQLELYREQIDAIDDRIIALLKERVEIVARVGNLKRTHVPEHFPIRPGREAQMVRRIVQAFVNSPFAAASAAQIWRVIIGASTAAEASLTLSVSTTENTRDLYWLAREYFGASAVITEQTQNRRVIADIVERRAAIGVLPTKGDWWVHLCGLSDAPKIFAMLPFVLQSTPSFPAFALAYLLPESSGNDLSLYVFEVSHEVSQNRLQSDLVRAGLEVCWLDTAMGSQSARLHLVEIVGFIAPDHPAFAGLAKAHFLGAYAKPLQLAR